MVGHPPAPRPAALRLPPKQEHVGRESSTIRLLSIPARRCLWASSHDSACAAARAIFR
jgi:hypothetical protein